MQTTTYVMLTEDTLKERRSKVRGLSSLKQLAGLHAFRRCAHFSAKNSAVFRRFWRGPRGDYFVRPDKFAAPPGHRPQTLKNFEKITECFLEAGGGVHLACR